MKKNTLIIFILLSIIMLPITASAASGKYELTK